MDRDSLTARRPPALLAAVDALPLNRRHWLVFGICAAGFFFDSIDLQTMSLVAPVLMREWALTPSVVGLVTGAAMLGMLIGSAGFGLLSDRIGRRATFQLAVAGFAVSGGLCALAQGPLTLIALRFCVGLGLGGLAPVVTTMMTEYLPARSRGRLIALWAISFPVGGLLATVLTARVLPVLGWRGVFLVGVAPLVLVPVIHRYLRETPRFLVSRGRLAEAERSARWIAGDAAGDWQAPVPPADRPRWVPPTALFSPAHRRDTVVAWLMSFGWQFAYFGSILWLPTLLVLARVSLDRVFLFTMGFQLSAVAGRSVMLFFVDRVGRRPVIVVAGVGAGVLMLLFGARHTVLWLVVTGYLLSICQDGGLSGIVPYTPELYPTALRGTGAGWANGLGRLGSLLATVLAGFLVAAASGYAVFVVFAGGYLIAAAVVVLLGRETKGRC